MSTPPSQFQRMRGGDGGLGYEITGAYSSINGEGRRRILMTEIERVLVDAGWPDITLNPDMTEGGVSYVPDYSRGYDDSIVRVDLLVPVEVQATGRDRLQLNVPPGQDWSQAVLEIVLVFVATWAQGLERS